MDYKEFQEKYGNVESGWLQPMGNSGEWTISVETLHKYFYLSHYEGDTPVYELKPQYKNEPKAQTLANMGAAVISKLLGF